MASTVTCLRCGRTPDASFTYCPFCGTRLGGAPQTAPSVGAASPSVATTATGYSAWATGPTVSYEHRRAVDRTRTGVGLIAAGSALGWIPVISFLGGLLVLAGAILVVLGREAFGVAHERNVLIAILLYVVGLIGSFILAGSLIGSIETAAYLPPAEAASAVTGIFDGALVGAMIVGVIAGLASVLFLWALLDTAGRVLIWASFFSSFALLFAIWVIVASQIGSAVASAFAGNPPDLAPLVGISNQINSFRLLTILPDLLAAGAAYVAWARIEQGIIPRRRGQPLQPA